MSHESDKKQKIIYRYNCIGLPNSNFTRERFTERLSYKYAGVNIDHYFNGFIFNKIPLLKKLKLREVIAAKILYGGVRAENNPDINSSAFRFSIDKESGLITTYTLNNNTFI